MERPLPSESMNGTRGFPQVPRTWTQQADDFEGRDALDCGHPEAQPYVGVIYTGLGFQ